MRHGESEANVAADNSDVPTTKLTKTGHLQAKKAAKYIASLKFLKIKHVLSSPFTRALDTAKPVAKALGLKVETINELREASSGVIDGVKFNDIKDIPKIGPKLVALDAQLNKWANAGLLKADPKWKAAIDEFEKITGSERSRQIYDRVHKVIVDYAKKYKGESILIVSHGGTIAEYLAVRYNLNANTIGKNFGKSPGGKNITNCHLSIINNKTDALEIMFDTKYLE